MLYDEMSWAFSSFSDECSSFLLGYGKTLPRSGHNTASARAVLCPGEAEIGTAKGIILKKPSRDLPKPMQDAQRTLGKGWAKGETRTYASSSISFFSCSKSLATSIISCHSPRIMPFCCMSSIRAMVEFQKPFML